MLRKLFKKNFLTEQEMFEIYGIKYLTKGKDAPDRYCLIPESENDLDRLLVLYQDIIDIFDGENRYLYFSSGNDRIEEGEILRALKLQDKDRVYKWRYFQSLASEAVRLNELHQTDPQKTTVNSHALLQFIRPTHAFISRTYLKKIWPVTFGEKRSDRWFAMILAIASALVAVFLDKFFSNPVVCLLEKIN